MIKVWWPEEKSLPGELRDSIYGINYRTGFSETPTVVIIYLDYRKVSWNTLCKLLICFLSTQCRCLLESQTPSCFWAQCNGCCCSEMETFPARAWKLVLCMHVSIYVQVHVCASEHTHRTALDIGTIYLIVWECNAFWWNTPTLPPLQFLSYPSPVFQGLSRV